MNSRSIALEDQVVRMALTGDYTTLQPVPQSYVWQVDTTSTWVCPINVIEQLPAGILDPPVRVLAVNMDIDLVREVGTNNILVRFSPSCTTGVSTLSVQKRNASVPSKKILTARIRKFEVRTDQPTRFTMFIGGQTGPFQAFNIDFDYNSSNRGTGTYR
ncbi:hypothetical protein [Mechercharimyces sp. CAU 1602]|uniref:hypothetical protein n=1 Tax=Mechercharimyces sp. CAU 1602 TaxID=2973933 RepID=UPI0021612D74|nr:hypothetical protein [Mechercharimyces sp. CAU 1602]MCS1350820.1 hypothetical protein [Mechercharimyces sp. CAU 1602]